MEKLHSRTNALCAAFVFVAALVVYLLTMGPSVCLWDCGEYVASSVSLGIPHPPGTPLLVMIGRVVDMALFFLPNHAYRLNLLAAGGSALVAMFIYLITVQVLVMMAGVPGALWQRLAVYVGGVVGGLFCAFSNTMWFCSLEFSEQSNFSLVPVVLAVWLVLKWATSRAPDRDRLLLLVAYVGFAGAGVHMISMITLPVIFLYVVLVDPAKRSDWRLWVSGLALSSVMYNMSWFMVACPVVALVAGGMALAGTRNRPQWRFCFLFAVMALIGFSSHLYMPVRAALNPSIDEDHPVTWKAMTEALDRKQYGSESMVSRSFWRRGTLAHQFGIESHMGYGGFHITQWFHFSLQDSEKSFLDQQPGLGALKLLVYLLPTGLMLFGWWYVWRRNRNAAIMLVGATLLTTVVLAWYMNFADGTRPERLDYLSWEHAGKPGAMPTVHREVRVRDYFYNAGFMFFAMWIGIAAGGSLLLLFASRRNLLRTALAPALVVACAISPLLPLTQNYDARDRHRNVLPFDYAYNILMSCDRDALLFTNGDNDTFPLWAVQEAFGIRRDVRILNLSLLNTNWYIHELQDVDPKVPISFTHEQIDALQPELNPFEAPTPWSLPRTNLPIVLPGRQQQNLLRVQDKMVLNVIDANRWRRPVYFAMTVSGDNFMGMGPFLRMEGMVLRVLPTRVTPDQQIDLQRTMYMLDHVYRLRNLSGPGVSLDEPAMGLVTNYSAVYLQAALIYGNRALAYKAQADTLLKAALAGKNAAAEPPAAVLALRQACNQALDTAFTLLDRCSTAIPGEWRAPALRRELLKESGRTVGPAAKQAESLAPQPRPDPNG